MPKPGFGGFVTMSLGIFPEIFSTHPENIQFTFANYPGIIQE